MSTKLNCWEFMNCGREPGGNKVHELGVCPAAECTLADGFNDGVNGGRFCWVLTGTLCKGEVQGIFARKLDTCLTCPFFELVEFQEDREFLLSES